ncbi:pyrimidodiazepine synthase-like isoform X2 [Lycorma delicatula]
MRFCPYAQRVHLVLNATKIPYDVVYINLITKPEWYVKMIPTGKVPALIVDDCDLYESLIISEFLDEKYGDSKLVSDDPLKKAKDKILIENFSKVSSVMYKIYFAPEMDQELFNDLLTALEPFEAELLSRSTDYFSGNSPGMVDYMIWPWFERMDVIPLLTGPEYSISDAKLPNLMKWRKRMLEDKVVKSHYLTSEQHAHHLKMRKAGTPDYIII